LPISLDDRLAGEVTLALHRRRSRRGGYRLRDAAECRDAGTRTALTIEHAVGGKETDIPVDVASIQAARIASQQIADVESVLRGQRLRW